ncbi:MAG: ATP-binding protein [Candidatus Eisenbacteria bacterium]|nr:ATP-binding protein [Candidatus Eisenbacteria bacterium]
METLRVVVVDDEPGMRTAVARVLSTFSLRVEEVDTDVGFLVTPAGTAEEGEAIIRVQPPDILLLDHKLPGMSGLDLLTKLEGVTDVLTIMITAYASLETAIVATKRGAFDFLAKPFTPDELKASLRKAAKHLMLQRQARRLALEKHQIRFQFISVLAHELKAPLAAVEGYLYLMRDQVSRDPVAMARVVERSLIRIDGMKKLIFDLLDLTRIESGQKKRDLAHLNVREVAAAALETCLPSAQERSITMEIHGPADIPMVADRGELDIVFNNLVSNAVKYNRDHGRVDVTLATEPGGVRIRVVDTGIGMSEEECGRLFREFVRIKNSKTRDILGSGLGLSIVRRISALYQGTVSVHSTPDVGTTFEVVLAGAESLPAPT